MTNTILETLTKAANEKPIVGYFGYGSLVNKHTLRTDYITLLPAELKGWRRTWDKPAGNDFNDNAVSLLTSRPAASSSLKGAVVFDFLENLPDVDKREHNYVRHEIEASMLDFPEQLSSVNCTFYTYEAIKAPSDHERVAPILQSYLDAVLQGFLHMHGEDGVLEFVTQTDNFNTPILEDRNNPIYPRSIHLTDHERDLIDYILQKREDITFI